MTNNYQGFHRAQGDQQSKKPKLKLETSEYLMINDMNNNQNCCRHAVRQTSIKIKALNTALQNICSSSSVLSSLPSHADMFAFGSHQQGMFVSSGQVLKHFNNVDTFMSLCPSS